MKINCPQCRKRSKTSIYDKTYSAYKTLWQQRRCDNCDYVWDEWEAGSNKIHPLVRVLNGEV